MRDIENYSPRLWELVNRGTIIKKGSALYKWLNSDQGQVVGKNGTYWIEWFSQYHDTMTDKARKQLDDIMQAVFGCEWLYNKTEKKGIDK